MRLDLRTMFPVKLLLIACLVNHAWSVALVEETPPKALNAVRVNSKTATLEIETKNGAIQLNLKKNGADGREARSVLYTRDENEADGAISRRPLSITRNCGAANKICISRGNELDTTIEISPDSERIKISRETNGTLTDCHAFLEGDEWYGGPQMRYQRWPVQHTYYEEEPYVPTHQTNMAVTERYWLTSSGFWIFVDERVPLFLDQNNVRDKHLCLIARNKQPYRTRDRVPLEYFMGFGSSPRTAHEFVVSAFLGKPEGHPDVRMIRHPIWSTWARYKMDVNERVVNEFADAIVANKFNNSQLEIDDNWETCYGSAVFDPVKFPNVTRLTNDLKKKGFRVTLWIHPFINEGCEPAYSRASKNGYFVKNLNGEVRMSWWQGANAATIDFTNSRAVDWWVGRLRALLALGIDAFKFDAGEISWLPQVANLNASIDSQPGAFTKDYVTALANNFNDLVEVRVGWRSQELPIFVRMIDKDTRWTWNNGLPTLITTLLQMNLNGYVNVLPDMIGGNGYLNNSLNGTFLPSRELFIRWLQANVFMPSLQYSFVPWDYDEEVVSISRVYTDLHAVVTPLIVRAMDEAVKTGAPVNPPVWWIAPDDPVAHKINDAYLLGEHILVAPVIIEGATERSVYLPAGKWRDPYNLVTYTGPIRIDNYPAPLHILPFFVREVNGTYAL